MSGAVQAEADDSIRLIRDSAAMIAPRGDLRRVRALRQTLPGFDRAVWAQIVEMGWPGLRVAEDLGGSGLGVAALCALMEELGAALVPEPLAGVVLAAGALRGEALDAVLSGRMIVLPAWQDRANTLVPTGGTVLRAGRVTGTKLFVPMAAGVDAFLVSTDAGLALVASDAPGLDLQTERTQDGGHFGTLRLVDVPAAPVAGLLALEEATLANAAYLLGVMDRAFAITLDYLRTRQQFGRAIGSFQVLQHRAADLKIQIALTRASITAAAATLDAQGVTPLAMAAVSRAKARAAEASMLVTRQAIQLHGGIGYTDEADIGLFLRKAMVLANLHGSAALHRARYAGLSPESDA